jgi:hypothetical protein
MRLLIVCTSLCVVAFSSVTNFEDPALASQPSFATDTKDQSRMASPDVEFSAQSRFTIPDGPRTPSRDVFELAFASFPMGNIEGKDASRFPPSRLDQPASFDPDATTDGDVDGQSAGQDAASHEGAAQERRATMCETLANAAQKNDLPIGFLIRLIWQESRFNPNAVSRVGAQGMAQFMPRVAADVGLEDPFDPLQALPASARLLGSLHRQFGNLGLAAAAYNAGPRRVQEWLAGTGPMPAETRNYVSAITGSTVEDWKEAGRNGKMPARAATSSCRELVALLRRAPNPFVAGLEQHITLGAAKLWGVQLAAGFSRDKALAMYARAIKQLSAVIGNQDPSLLSSVMRNRGTRLFYQVRIGADTRPAADDLCNKIRKAGGACFVLKNRA